MLRDSVTLFVKNKQNAKVRFHTLMQTAVVSVELVFARFLSLSCLFIPSPSNPYSLAGQITDLFP